MTDSIYQDGAYLENNPGWHEEDSEWKARQIAEILAANGVRPSTVCEVGCGAGEILKQLQSIMPDKGDGTLDADIRFSGYEISPQAFAICGTKATRNLEFHLQNLLEIETAQFDVVMVIDVFEHIEDYLGFLRQLRCKGRYQVFHIPLDLSVQTVLRASPIETVREAVGHIHYFTKETALATLRDTGYRIVDHRYTRGSLELPNRGWKSGLLKLPRKIMLSLSEDWAVRVLGGCSLLVLAEPANHPSAST